MVQLGNFINGLYEKISGQTISIDFESIDDSTKEQYKLYKQKAKL